jgi:hypothetical protein
MLFKTIIGALVLLAGDASAQSMLRFSCSRLTIERLDPLVSPGEVPSPHIHQVGGGNSFNATMDPVAYDPAEVSTCVSGFGNYHIPIKRFPGRIRNSDEGRRFLHKSCPGFPLAKD